MVLFVSLIGEETGKPENRKLHPGSDLKEVLCETTIKMLGFWVTVGGEELEHEWDEMRKERCTKTNIGIVKEMEKKKF